MRGGVPVVSGIIFLEIQKKGASLFMGHLFLEGGFVIYISLDCL